MKNSIKTGTQAQDETLGPRVRRSKVKEVPVNEKVGVLLEAFSDRIPEEMSVLL